MTAIALRQASGAWLWLTHSGSWKQGGGVFVRLSESAAARQFAWPGGSQDQCGWKVSEA